MIEEADKILAKYEDDNEYHLHECDRSWIIGAMIEYAESEVKKLTIHDVSKCNETKLTKCYNCGDMVEMISTGEVCPHCFC